MEAGGLRGGNPTAPLGGNASGKGELCAFTRGVSEFETGKTTP